MATKKDTDKKEPEQISAIGNRLLVLEKPVIIKRMIIGLAILCLILFLLDFVIHRHGYFEAEHLPGFYGFAGFAAFSFIIFSVKGLRKLIWRPEDYYSPRSVDNEFYPPEGLEVKDYGDA